MEREPLYRPLEGTWPIRFIRLLPGQWNESVAVELVHDHLRYPAQYETTSYTWGSSDNTKTILCNEKSFSLRENAFNFLRRLRLPANSRLLWMDCICINQDDVEERSEQVELMHQIYRNAKAVLIWLGEDDNDSNLATAYLSTLNTATFMREAVDWIASGVSKLEWSRKSFLLDELPPTDEGKRLVKAIIALIQRPWTRRIWVQQEAAVCSNTRVMCGDSEFSWDQFFSAAWLLLRRTSLDWPDWLDQDNTLTDLCLVAAQRIQFSRVTHLGLAPSWDMNQPWQQNKKYSSTFSKLLRDCWGCEATDPRDKIYAVFNLTTLDSGSLVKRPPVDYRIPWQMVYIKTAQWLFDVDKSSLTVLLECAGRSRQSGLDIPSWVPDWRQFFDMSFIPHRRWSAGGLAYLPSTRFLSLPRPKASEDALPSYSYINTSNKRKRIPIIGLELSCIMLDRIVYMSPILESSSPQLKDHVDKIQTIMDQNLAFSKTYVPTYMTGEVTEEAYAGAIIANTTHNDELASKEYEAGFCEFRSWLAARIPGPNPVYWEALLNSSALRENPFCVTAHGLMCLVPKISKVGDYVSILSGFGTPFALRRVGGHSRQQYELLGYCYVHRMMKSRCWNIIEEFKCKYRFGSEDEVLGETLANQPQSDSSPIETGPCEYFPWNSKRDYRHIHQVLGKRLMTLV